MARRPISFDGPGHSSRLDPRRRVTGGDIFERRALKRAISAVERGTEISKLDMGALTRSGQFDPGGLRGKLSSRLVNSGRSVGERKILNTPERRQALFGAQTAVAFNKPFSDFQRRQLGFTEDQDNAFRSSLTEFRRERGLFMKPPKRFRED